MEQRVTLITIGVADLARSRAFYEHLGWRGQEVDETVFFQAGALALVLWGRDKLAADVGVTNGACDFSGIALAHNVRPRDEVEEIINLAREAGGFVTSEPAMTFYGGYAGYFRDSDGNPWEIAHNPGFALRTDGSLVLPDFNAGPNRT